MTYVLRRKEPRHDGTRYFNDKGPPAKFSGKGAWFSCEEDADAARRKLREPHMWEALTMRDADCKDAREQLDAARRPKPSALTVALLAHVASLRGR